MADAPQTGAEELEKMFVYLDELRDSGETNMYGARPYLVDEFGIVEAEASLVLKKWMTTWGKRHPVKEVYDGG